MKKLGLVFVLTLVFGAGMSGVSNIAQSTGAAPGSGPVPAAEKFSLIDVCDLAADHTCWPLKSGVDEGEVPRIDVIKRGTEVLFSFSNSVLRTPNKGNFSNSILKRNSTDGSVALKEQGSGPNTLKGNFREQRTSNIGFGELLAGEIIGNGKPRLPEDGVIIKDNFNGQPSNIRGPHKVTGDEGEVPRFACATKRNDIPNV